MVKAAVVHAFGELPRYESFADPSAGPNEVLVQVEAAGLHPIVRALADGSHYGSTADLPLIPGVDGVGRLEDGTRVYFGRSRPAYGTMAEVTVAKRLMCTPIPDSLEDSVAAAIFNPGMSSWLALQFRAKLIEGESVLVLGATGTAGHLAVQIARHLGAGCVIAAGRNEQALKALCDLGADATISLRQSDGEVAGAIAKEADEHGIDVIIDYLWGQPTELVIAGIMRIGLMHSAPKVRLIEVGESAGSTISLPADVLRSSGLEIYGSGGGTIPVEQIVDAFPEFMALAASGALQIDVDEVPLADVEDVWQRRSTGGHRIVFRP